MIEEVLSRLKKGEDLEEILKSCGWQTFEQLVAYIFEENGFETKIHYRFKTDKRYEIDVLARKSNICFLVECKKWRGKTANNSRILKAVEKHKRREEEFRKFTGKNCKAIITTLLDQPLVVNEMKIIPVARLNYFLTKLILPCS